MEFAKSAQSPLRSVASPPPANTQTLVVPSPTSSSCTLEILTSIFAAGLSKAILFKIVAPSFVTITSPVEAEWSILFMPLGPCALERVLHESCVSDGSARSLTKVDLTRSDTAIAPTKELRRACRAWIIPCQREKEIARFCSLDGIHSHFQIFLEMPARVIQHCSL